MDEAYDCKNVTAPMQLPGHQVTRFEEMAIAVAEEIELHGIMDLEVILHQNELKLLEIDARLPSQTPMTVYWSTGINMVEVLANLTIHKNLNFCVTYERPVLVEHIKVCGPTIESFGEHIMALDGPLALKTDFFGADEAIASFEPGKHQWVCTMIFSGSSRDEIHMKRAACHKKIIEHAQIL
jgi:pyrrolysine biosynthesis protein PylC